MSPDGLQQQKEQLAREGWVVLEERLPVDFIDRLRERFDELLAERAASEPVNRGVNRYQMFLPWEPPFSEPLLFANEAVLTLVRASLGEEPVMVYLASDTPLPGSDYQAIHADTRHLWPDRAEPRPYGLVLNVPLVHCSEENGSLEFWPGTHLIAGKSREEMAEMAPSLESRRANMPAGSLLVRDLRMWHRGTPNRGVRSRPHLALVYTLPWYRFEQPTPEIAREDYAALTEEYRRMLRFSRLRT